MKTEDYPLISIGMPRQERLDEGEIYKACQTLRPEFQAALELCSDGDPVRILKGTLESYGYGPIVCRGKIIGTISAASMEDIDLDDYAAQIKKISFDKKGRRIATIIVYPKDSPCGAAINYDDNENLDKIQSPFTPRCPEPLSEERLAYCSVLKKIFVSRGIDMDYLAVENGEDVMYISCYWRIFTLKIGKRAKWIMAYSEKGLEKTPLSSPDDLYALADAICTIYASHPATLKNSLQRDYVQKIQVDAYLRQSISFDSI